ncbi:unnamed protein product [Meloidogyne enterolobii]|uniref:Uncharacterized protein n=2 Tax=Meloidogyne enterolobii TaxID=390850 RepID=A0A6V7Y757_MELEN|nr:unnamed protein product [Meloidogyne enterolobii]
MFSAGIYKNAHHLLNYFRFADYYDYSFFHANLIRFISQGLIYHLLIHPTQLCSISLPHMRTTLDLCAADLSFYGLCTLNN